MKGMYKAKGGPGQGPGGLPAAMKRHAQDITDVNDTPCGPYPHTLGFSGDGGCHGDQTVTGKMGYEFSFEND